MDRETSRSKKMVMRRRTMAARVQNFAFVNKSLQNNKQNFAGYIRMRHFPFAIFL